MGIRFFSDRNRPVHMAPYPLERLARSAAMPDLRTAPRPRRVDFRRPDAPSSIVNAMGEYQAMMDAIRDGLVNRAKAGCPDDPKERAEHLKAFGYFCDAAMVGTCRLPDAAMLAEPFANPDIDRLAQDLRTRQTKTLASGIDMIMADLKDSMEAPPSTIGGHTHAIVFLYDIRAIRRRTSRAATGSGMRRRRAPACGRRKPRWSSPTTSACSAMTRAPIPAAPPTST